MLWLYLFWQNSSAGFCSGMKGSNCLFARAVLIVFFFKNNSAQYLCFMRGIVRTNFILTEHITSIGLRPSSNIPIALHLDKNSSNLTFTRTAQFLIFLTGEVLIDFAEKKGLIFSACSLVWLANFDGICSVNSSSGFLCFDSNIVTVWTGKAQIVSASDRDHLWRVSFGFVCLFVSATTNIKILCPVVRDVGLW